MARNTNINQLLFPVELQPVYVKGNSLPIEGYYNIPPNLYRMLSKEKKLNFAL
jgi:hypothetical protein